MAIRKKIELFVDIASLYSFVALEDLLRYLPVLTANGVQVDILPVFLAAINKASGNSPPWLLKAKADYSEYDRKRALERVGISEVSTPADPKSMTWALTQSPLRALHFIRANFPEPTYLAAMRTLFHRFWTQGGVDMRQDENLRQVLLYAAEQPDGSGRRLFTEQDVDAIMRGRDEMKDFLRSTTDVAVRYGAFGAPWIWATNADRVEHGQPFFGSDRFNHIYKFLGIPFHDVEPLPPTEAKPKM